MKRKHIFTLFPLFLVTILLFSACMPIDAPQGDTTESETNDDVGFFGSGPLGASIWVSSLENLFLFFSDFDPDIKLETRYREEFFDHPTFVSWVSAVQQENAILLPYLNGSLTEFVQEEIEISENIFYDLPSLRFRAPGYNIYISYIPTQIAPQTQSFSAFLKTHYPNSPNVDNFNQDTYKNVYEASITLEDRVVSALVTEPVSSSFTDYDFLYDGFHVRIRNFDAPHTQDWLADFSLKKTTLTQQNETEPPLRPLSEVFIYRGMSYDALIKQIGPEIRRTVDEFDCWELEWLFTSKQQSFIVVVAPDANGRMYVIAYQESYKHLERIQVNDALLYYKMPYADAVAALGEPQVVPSTQPGGTATWTLDDGQQICLEITDGLVTGWEITLRELEIYGLLAKQGMTLADLESAGFGNATDPQNTRWEIWNSILEIVWDDTASTSRIVAYLICSYSFDH